MKRYKCPYCETRVERHKMSNHIKDKHIESVPEGYSVDRLAFNILNKKENGNCVICKRITEWNEDKKRYERYCSDKCKHEAARVAKENMKKVYKKEHLLDDVDHQIKMLNSRKISGVYKYSDGTEFNYVGSLEKGALEYFDKVLKIDSCDILTNTPIIKYKLDGKVRNYIPDFYLKPYNLIIEIKDGGTNKNTNPAMVDTRRKTIAKEEAVRELNKYNYLRLTNNDFTQLTLTINTIKNNLNSYDEEINFVHNINEDVDFIHLLSERIIEKCNSKQES